MKKYILVACMALVCLASFAIDKAHAAEDVAQSNQQAVEDLTSVTSLYATNQVVITATRTEALLKDVPASMEVITAEDIKKMGATNVRDALRKSPGVVLPFSSRVYIRGMSESHTLILINGRKMASHPRASFNVNDALTRVNVDNIERIEILRGPASALYGSEAMGGVINIITKKSEELSIDIGASASTNEFNNYYSLDTGRLGKFDMLLDARFTEVRRTNDHYSNDNENNHGPRTFFNLDMGYEINEDHELRLNTEYFWEDLEQRDFNDDGSTNKDKFDTNTRYGTTLTYSGNTDNHNFSVTGSYNLTHEDDSDLDSANVTSEEEADYSVLGFEAQDSWAINDMNLLTFGGEFKRTGADNTGKDFDNLKTDYFAAYIQDEISLFNDALLIIPAVRYDDYDSFGGEFSPKLGVTWNITANHRLKGTYGLGFRAPNLWELYLDGIWRGTTLRLGNPDLKPEESVGYDIGYEGEYKNFFGSITYFNNQIENLINDRVILQDAGGNDYYTFDNIQEASMSGVELDLGVTFLEYFTLTGFFNYLDAMNDTLNKRLQYRAKHTYLAELGFNDGNGLTASLWSRWSRNMVISSERFGDLETINYSTVHFVIRKEWNERFAIFAGVDNIFDTEDQYNEDYVDGIAFRTGVELTF